MSESPSELLTRAADRIRDLAAYFGDYEKAAEFKLPDGTPRFESATDAWLYNVLDRNAPRDGAAWIAALSPAVAPHLESILRATAVHLQMAGQDTRCGMCVPVLALACELLGEDQP